MNVRKIGILIETDRKVAKINSINKQKEKRQYTSYIEMVHKDDGGVKVVTPFAEHFIKAMEKQGFKDSQDFEIGKKGEGINDASRAEIEKTVAAKAN